MRKNGESRFPNTVWYCDNCGACLSEQYGFNDHKYIWQCTECGYKNSISRANIRLEKRKGIKRILDFVNVKLGYLLTHVENYSFIFFMNAIILILCKELNVYNIKQNLSFEIKSIQDLYLCLVSYGLIIYPISLAISVIAEKTGLFYGITYKKNSILYDVYFNVFNDLVMPLYIWKCRKKGMILAIFIILLWCILLLFSILNLFQILF